MSLKLLSPCLVRSWIGLLTAWMVVLAAAVPAWSADEVNLYSARKEALMRPLLDAFTENTGIEVRVVTAKGGQLHQRLLTEGRNSPADVLLTVDAGNLWRAAEEGLLQPVSSPVLEEAVPARYRASDGQWFGLSLRARVAVYATDRVSRDELGGYLSLADPKWSKRLLVRSSSNIYNQSLIAAMISRFGVERTEAWARGLVDNLARPPSGGDRDQIRAVAAGEGDLAIVNSYYYARMLASDEAERLAGTAIHFPADPDMATHVNISGAGIAKHAPHPEAGLRLLEFLVSPEAQALYAGINHEYPILQDVPLPEGPLTEWGPIDADHIPLQQLGQRNAEAVRLADRAGWR